MNEVKILTSVVIDGRKGMTQGEVRRIAQQTLDITPIQEDTGLSPGDHGYYLAGDPLYYYHVKSICEGMYVASTIPLTPSQTIPMVVRYLESHKSGM